MNKSNMFEEYQKQLQESVEKQVNIDLMNTLWGTTTGNSTPYPNSAPYPQTTTTDNTIALDQYSNITNNPNTQTIGVAPWPWSSTTADISIDILGQVKNGINGYRPARLRVGEYYEKNMDKTDSNNLSIFKVTAEGEKFYLVKEVVLIGESDKGVTFEEVPVPKGPNEEPDIYTLLDADALAGAVLKLKIKYPNNVKVSQMIKDIIDKETGE